MAKHTLLILACLAMTKETEAEENLPTQTSSSQCALVCTGNSCASLCPNPLPISSTEKDLRLSETIIEFGINALRGSDQFVTVRRNEPFIRFERLFLGRIYLFFNLKLELTNLTFTTPMQNPELDSDAVNRAKLHANLKSRYNRITGGGFRAIFWKNDHLMLSLSAAIEDMPPTELEIDGAYFIATTISADVSELAQENVRVKYDWLRLDAGLRLDWNLDFWQRRLSPYFGVDFSMIHSNMDIEYDSIFSEALRDRIGELGYAPSIPEETWLRIYAPLPTVGLEARVWGPINLNASGSAFPFGDRTIWTGTLSVRVKGD